MARTKSSEHHTPNWEVEWKELCQAYMKVVAERNDLKAQLDERSGIKQQLPALTHYVEEQLNR